MAGCWQRVLLEVGTAFLFIAQPFIHFLSDKGVPSSAGNSHTYDSTVTTIVTAADSGASDRAQRSEAQDAVYALCGVPLAGGSEWERGGGDSGGDGGGEEEGGCAGPLGPFWKHRCAVGCGYAGAAAGTSADCVDNKQ